jgi:hypothetical protein
VALGNVSVRSLFETLLLQAGRDAKVDPKHSRTARTKAVFSKSNPCSGLINYLTVVAEDNGVDADQLLAAGSDLYHLLSNPTHGGHVSRSRDRIDAEVFASVTNSVLAMMGFASFYGRDARLYVDGAPAAPIKLRVPPAARCVASEADIRSLPFRQ